MTITGKKIIVTGAASGIGAETAKVLKAHGATIIGMDLNEPQANVDQYIKVDFSDPASIETAVASVPNGIDALCNIAGVPPTKERALVLKVNFLGLRHFTELVIDKLSDGASIVNAASLAGLGWPEAGDQIKALLVLRDFNATEAFCESNGVEPEGGRSYFFTKEALIVWTMMNRWTWRDRGIRMNCVSPGPVETPILPDFLETLGERAAEDAKVMDRPGQPEDIAPVIAFMCSDESSWIRGANIPVDGGMYQHVLCNMHGHI
ncbi:MAG: coniferyl-alcohol dehydrogenase [Desulfobacterales bacterium]|nr:coniferyl-alcohol dehydrogenase [Desulfobacterales bacterium]